MARKPKTIEQLEKERRHNCIFAAAVFFVIGAAAVIGAVSIGGGEVFLWVLAVFALLIGAVALIQGRTNKLPPAPDSGVNTALRGDNEDMSARSRIELAKSIEKCSKKMHDHGGIREVMANRPIYISGACLAGITAFDLIMWFAGYYSVVFIVLNIGMVLVFIVCLSGSDYKKALKAYANPIGGYSGRPGEVCGATVEEADADFTNGALFISGVSVICLGERYVFASNGKEFYAFDVKHIVWAFPRRTLEYQYYNGIYSGTLEKYTMLFCLDDGRAWQFACEVGACNLIADRLAQYGNDIVTGWSDDLNRVYTSDPKNFRLTVSEISLPDPYTVQF